MKHTIGLILVLGGIWVLWSWHFTPLLLAFGALSCACVLLIALRMKIVDEEGAPIHLPLHLFRYLPWLFWEIAKANLDVAVRILRPRLSISPRVIEVLASQRTDVGHVIYANSITLTPGTVSIHTEGNMISVHALTREAADGVLSGEMGRRVSRLESTK